MENELLEKDVIRGELTTNFHAMNDIAYDDVHSIEYPSISEFGKTLFLVYNGVLRQFRIKEVVVFPFNWGIKIRECLGNYTNVTTLEVAGVGMLKVGLYMYGGEFNFKIYESIDDYKSDKCYKMRYTSLSKENCGKRFGVTFSSRDIFGKNPLARWQWNGIRACSESTCELMPICYIVNERGFRFPGGWSPDKLSGYNTKEECEKDNIINICCFDGEGAEKTEEKKTIRLSIEIEESDIDRIKSIAKVIG